MSAWEDIADGLAECLEPDTDPAEAEAMLRVYRAAKRTAEGEAAA